MSTELSLAPLPRYGDLPKDKQVLDFFLAAPFEPVLSDGFLSQYKDKQPAWGAIGYVTYKRTYARPVFASDLGIEGSDTVPLRTEEFWETAARVINGLWHIIRCHSARKNIEFDEHVAQRKARAMFERMWVFKWLPPGRGLWMMGTTFMYTKGSAALNNCFAYETEIITSEGIKQIGDLTGKTATLLTKNGKWVDAPIMSFGKQNLMKLTVGRQGDRKIIYATPEHRWFVKSKEGTDTYKTQERYTRELKVNQRLAYAFGQGIKNIRPSAFGIAHGIVYGDGSQSTTSKNAFVYLCGEKDNQLAKYFPLSPQSYDLNKCEGGAVLVSDLPNTYRTLPSLSESKSYLYGFLAGYIAADGSVSKVGAVRLASASRSNLEYVTEICHKIGIGVYQIREETCVSNLTNMPFTMYTLNFMRNTLSTDLFVIQEHKDRFINSGSEEMESQYWRVISVEESDRFEEVYCPQVPETHSFALAGNILTGNCGFVSTENIAKEGSEPFTWGMDMSMLGVGIGFDTRGVGSVTIQDPSTSTHYVIEDSREGWVKSVGMVIDAYLLGKAKPSFDYSLIRPKGTPIRGFGGVAEGHQFLEICHQNLEKFFTARTGKAISEADIVDIFNEIGACVVSGNVRRSAQIALGSADNEEYISLKHHPELHPNCWNSNNTVFAKTGQDYSRIAELIVSRGEPGLLWLDNVRAYGRMGDPKNNKDKDAMGTNPCGEQTLHSYELCCLVETFPSLHEEENDFNTTLKQAYLYTKGVTLVPSHSKRTNKIMGRNSRIGCSMSGIQQARVKFGTRRFLDMASAGYTYLRERDDNYSDWLQVRHSIKITSVKPSGTVSLLAGVSPGIHYPIERTYLRRIRFAKGNPMVDILSAAGYRTYPAPEQPLSTVVVDFPIKEMFVDRIEREVSLWEQMEFCAAIQSVWADNQVSITVKFDPKERNIVNSISEALSLYESRLKSISFLPLSAGDAGYAAAPYEAIDDDQYAMESMMLQPYDFNEEVVDDVLNDECTTGTCPIR